MSFHAMSIQARPLPHLAHRQRGGTLLGLIIGLALGLAIALAAAVYITKAPLPFMNRFQQRPQGTASAPGNWNPNAGLTGSAAPPAAVAGASGPGNVSSAPLSPKALEALGRPAGGVLHPQGAVTTSPAAASAAVPAPQPAGAQAPATNLQYIVQIGAYSNRADAEAQRAKVALTGVEAHLDQREVGSRTLWRVRVGPFASADQADKAQRALNDNGISSVVVRAPK